MPIKPLNDNLLIKSIKPEKTESGLLYPDTNKEENIAEGEVVDIGQGHKTIMGVIPLKVKKGDKVIYAHYSPRKIKHKGEEFMLICEDDVLAVVE
jgi:chaperonin GroES